jgi:hypothetical protein
MDVLMAFETTVTTGVVDDILAAKCAHKYQVTYKYLKETEHGARNKICIYFDHPKDRERFRAAFQPISDQDLNEAAHRQPARRRRGFFSLLGFR